MDISVTIVNYNTAHCIEKCLESVLKQIGVVYEVIVVDNASEDRSVEVIRAFPSVKLIVNSINVGFGVAHNQAFLSCNGRFVLILNPDVFLREEFMVSMVSYMDEHSNIGISGPQIIHGRKKIDLRPHYTYRGQQSANVHFGHLPGKIAWLSGSCLFTRRSLLKQLGGFDPDFFLYCEEVDLCLRVRKAGFSLGFNPDCTVRHLKGESFQGSGRPKPLGYQIKSQIIFWTKHYPPKSIRRLVMHMYLVFAIRYESLRMLRWMTRNQKYRSSDILKFEAAYMGSRDWLQKNPENFIRNMICFVSSVFYLLRNVIFKINRYIRKQESTNLEDFENNLPSLKRFN